MNKFNLILGTLLLASSSMLAANANVTDSIQAVLQDSVVDTAAQAADDDVIFDKPDQMPEYPGGIQAVINYLATNIKYPQQAHKKKIQGRVIVEFVVDKEGNVVECKAKRKVHPLLDAEAIRVVEAMPKWTPGTLNGEPVRVRYMIPVVFRLNNPAKKAR